MRPQRLRGSDLDAARLSDPSEVLTEMKLIWKIGLV